MNKIKLRANHTKRHGERNETEYKSMKQKQQNIRERIFKMKVLLAPASGELGTVELSMAPVQGCDAN